MKHIVLFKTTRDAIRAERLCKRYDIACKVIPVPRDISSECGMALEIGNKDIASVSNLFNIENVNVDIYTK